MDGTFRGVHSPNDVNYQDMVWFTVEDKNHNFFDNCVAPKESYTNSVTSSFGEMVFTAVKQDDFVMKLNRGDRIRVIGHFLGHDLFFVDKILMIK